MTETKSYEFGRGFVNQLVRFARHMEREDVRNILSGIKKTADMEIIKLYEGKEKKWLSLKIESWMNAASDHLYDLELPEQWKDTKLAKMVKELRDLGLEMGHGFTKKIWTLKDVEKINKLLEDIAMEIDRKLGVPVKSGYS